MGGINRIPGGYLDLVGTETGGKTPSLGMESVQPIVDLFPFYARQTLAQSFVATVSGPINSAGVHVIPQNEIWILLACSALMTATAVGDGAALHVAFAALPRGTPPGANTWSVDLGEKIGTVAGNGLQWAFWFPQPVVVAGGTSLRIQVAGTYGIARSLSTYVTHYKLIG